MVKEEPSLIEPSLIDLVSDSGSDSSGSDSDGSGDEVGLGAIGGLAGASDYKKKVTWLKCAYRSMDSANETATSGMKRKVRDADEVEKEEEEKRQRAMKNEKKRTTKKVKSLAQVAQLETEYVADRTFCETDDEGEMAVVAVRKRTPNGRKLFAYCKPAAGGDEVEYTLTYVHKKLGQALPSKGY